MPPTPEPHQSTLRAPRRSRTTARRSSLAHPFGDVYVNCWPQPSATARGCLLRPAKEVFARRASCLCGESPPHGLSKRRLRQKCLTLSTAGLSQPHPRRWNPIDAAGMLARWSFKSFGRRLTRRSECFSEISPRTTLVPRSRHSVPQLPLNSLSPQRHIRDFLQPLNRPRARYRLRTRQHRHDTTLPSTCDVHEPHVWH